MKAERGLSILAVTLRYPPYVAGGYELLTRDAVEALRQRGHRVRVLAGRGERFAGEEEVLPWLEPGLDRDENLFELSFRGSNVERFRLHFFRLANYRAARRALRASGADVLLFFNLGLVSLAPVLAARHAGVPTVGYVADPWPANHWLEAWRADPAQEKGARLELLTQAWRGFRALIRLGPLLVCSADLAARLRADGCASEELEVLHLGLPPDAAAAAAGAGTPSRNSGAPLRVACISSLWPGKGQHVLLSAARDARAAGADVELVLAGTDADPGYRAELEELASSAELAGAVRFAGALDRAELSALLASVHVLAMPSLWSEPFGLATLEGLAHGLAVIASDAGASPEILVDGETGLLVRAGDVPAWAAALRLLEGDEELRARLGRHGRREVEERRTHARFVDGLEAALLGAVGGGGA